MGKILVTGGAGYIGSVLVPILLQDGNQVTVLDNFMYRQPSLLDCCYDPKLTVVRGDVRDEDAITKHAAGADFIFPLACLTGAPLCDRDPFAAQTVNLEAVKMLLRIRRPDQKIIFPTTNSGYGIGQESIACDEKTPLRPVSLYGRLKVEAEQAILASGNSITLRLATAFGVSPRMRLDLLVNDFTYRAVSDRFIVVFEPHFVRNYIHVRDVAKVFLHSMKHFEKMKNETYNVGLSGCNITKLELCHEIKKAVGDFDIKISETGKDPDKRNYLVSNAKIEAVGFKPEFSLQDGIRELVKCYQVIKRDQYANV